MLDKIKAGVYISWRCLYRLLKERVRWLGAGTIGAGRISVYYGHDYIPSRMQRSGGAYIKFQDLADEYPNTLRDATILYLVSSALPDFPKIMVREAKRRGAVFVLNQNGVAYNGWHGRGWEKTNKPMQWLLKEADYVVYQSHFCKIGADRFLGESECPWEILYNPVDTEVFLPSPFKVSGAKLLLAGSHQHFYRAKTVIEAMQLITRRMPEATLTIAGRYTWRKTEGECLAEARNYAKARGVGEKVTFVGSYSQAEAAALFQKHHVLMHTQYNDCCPRLVVEAMSCGLPIVYSKSGGVPELVGDDAGIGIPAVLDWEEDHPPEPVDLAEATLKIFEDLESFSASARRRAVTMFDVRPWRACHEMIFKRLIEERSAGLR